jgi:hypothetical protein
MNLQKTEKMLFLSSGSQSLSFMDAMVTVRLRSKH